MKLRQLECFCAVMVTGTMTAAARQLKTSQPGVSSLIAGLEQVVGFALFERRKGRLVPTPEARHFYAIAERIVADMESAQRTAGLIAEGKHGQLTIATLPGFGLNVVPEAIALLRKNRPEARFKILTRSTDAVRLMIPSEQCDIAIVEAPVEGYSGLTETLSFDCVAIMQKNNPLAAHDVIMPGLIKEEPIVALYPEHPTTLQLKRIFSSHQARWAPVVEARFFATCCEIVRLSGGVAIVDPLTAKRNTHGDMVTRPFEPRVVFEVALTFPGEGPYSQLAKDFVATLKMIVQSREKVAN